ncbi:hypothetical protein MCUN1_001042 [Malassezia cuniculi]|uniref:Origin recognition complex subunit 2 n=1 Tax=Malassezia cuniculi TaxID=948313 RepID=A0AAF0ES47_9BASI|nr:hypothetical protein MCUN1_001042 [Malassezia cuniculi]
MTSDADAQLEERAETPISDGGSEEGQEPDTNTLLDAAPPQFVKSFKTINFVRATSSDAWFLSNSHRRNFASRKLGRDLLRGSSGKRISERLEPLDLGPLAEIAQATVQDGEPDPPARTAHSKLATEIQLDSKRVQILHSQLLSGFNLMLYGVGDKQPVVQRIIQSGSQKYGGAGVVIQGAAGRALNADRILDAIEAAVLLHLPLDPPLPHVADPPMFRISRVAQRRISQNAAVQVLSTLTARARSLFFELSELQLREAGKDAHSTPRIPFASLVRNAQRQFIASSDQGVKQLLGEMVDHGLIAVLRGAAAVGSSHAIAVGDELTIPLPHDQLRAVISRVQLDKK